MGRKNQLALQLTKMIEDMKNTCKRIFQKPKRNGKIAYFVLAQKRFNYAARKKVKEQN